MIELWREAFFTAWHALRSQRLRTTLVALSVSIGAGAITLMVSLSKSAIATISHGIEESGGRHLIFIENRPVSKYARPEFGYFGLPSGDAVALRQHLHGVEQVSFIIPALQHQPLTAGERHVDVDVAIGKDARPFMNQHLILGNDIPEDDSGDLSRVTILCKPLAITLFGSPQAALGQSVVVFGRRFTVVGISEEGGKSAFDFGGVDRKVVAFFSIPEMVSGEGVIDDGLIILRDNGTESHDYIIAMANAVIQPRHYFADDVEYTDLERVIERFEMIFTALRVLTGLIAAISLIIAGAGIMNVLLASLRQRVQELGIRRAIGATRADIRRQLLLESTLLGGLGGAFGSLMGVLVVLAIGPLAGRAIPGWVTEVSVAAAVTAILVSLSAGLVFGLEPARRAGKMDVISCLRGQA